MLELGMLYIPLAFFAADPSICAEGEAARLREPVSAAPRQPIISSQ